MGEKDQAPEGSREQSGLDQAGYAQGQELQLAWEQGLGTSGTGLAAFLTPLCPVLPCHLLVVQRADQGAGSHIRREVVVCRDQKHASMCPIPLYLFMSSVTVPRYKEYYQPIPKCPYYTSEHLTFIYSHDYCM